MTKILKIDEIILSILSSSKIDGYTLFLPPKQIDRKKYLQVNKIIEAMGGKWNKKEKGHVFDCDPTEKLDNVLLTGEIETTKISKNGYFPTPLTLVNKMISVADIRPGMKILEPSAGQGHIADTLNDLDCCLSVIEILPENINVLREKGHNLVATDFLTWTCDSYDRIIMNPPFERQQDIDHVLHAHSLLKKGGRVVSIMSSGVVFRENKKTALFRGLIDDLGYWERNPDESFKESGTTVNTIMVMLNKK